LFEFHSIILQVTAERVRLRDEVIFEKNIKKFFFLYCISCYNLFTHVTLKFKLTVIISTSISTEKMQ